MVSVTPVKIDLRASKETRQGFRSGGSLATKYLRYILIKTFFFFFSSIEKEPRRANDVSAISWVS